MVWLPGVASQYQTHCRQVSMPGTAARVASFQGPLSILTSTAATPLCWAQATPATGVRPGDRVLVPFGTSMRDSVLIGACCDQPRCAQEENSEAQVVSFRSVTHLVADTYPYSPGTTIRAGKPWATGSGWPFMPMASSAFRPSSTVCTGVPQV